MAFVPDSVGVTHVYSEFLLSVITSRLLNLNILQTCSLSGKDETKQTICQGAVHMSSICMTEWKASPKKSKVGGGLDCYHQWIS